MRFRILLTPFSVLQVAMALMQAGADVDVANCVSERGERGGWGGVEGNGVAGCVTDDQFHDSMAFRLRASESESRGRRGRSEAMAWRRVFTLWEWGSIKREAKNVKC